MAQTPDERRQLHIKALRNQARALDSAANIAGGNGNHALANSIWAFAAELRRRAKEVTTGDSTES